jgi:hypothetical protein
VKIIPFFIEQIGLITIEYLPDWNLVKTTNIDGETIDYESYLRSCGKRLACLAEDKGFTRIQIGRMDDFYFAHVEMEKYIEIDRVHIAKFF